MSWGCAFLDFDNDGWKDLVVVNGHVFPEVDRLNIDIHSRDRAHPLPQHRQGHVRRHIRAGRPGDSRAATRRAVSPVGDIDNDGTLEDPGQQSE